LTCRSPKAASLLPASGWSSNVLALDPFAFEEDGLSAPEVDVSWGKIVEALVIAGMVLMRHEGRDLAFEVAGQVVVLKQDAVLERLMPALNLALGRRVIGGAADVFHFLLIQPLREIRRDVRRAVIRQQTRSVNCQIASKRDPLSRPISGLTHF
jgi:hypothetical protein